MKNNILKNAVWYAFTAIISIILIWYVLYHLFSGSDNDVETVPAVVDTRSNSLLLDAYIVRDETVLFSEKEGGVNYLFNDGDRVGSNSVIANIYSGAGAEEVADRILDIDKKLNILENSTVSDKATKMDTNAIDSKISELLFKMRDNLQNDDLEYVVYKKDEFLTYLNKRQVVTQNVSGFEEQIISLTRERETLSGQLINLEGNITAEAPGFFYSQIDGYEEVFDVSAIDDMTLDDYSKLVDSKPIDYSNTLAVGKMVNSDQWYILSEITAEQLKLFGEGFSYEVKFPFNSDVTVKMVLHRIIRENDSDRVVLIFRTNVMPEGFSYFRKQNIQIIQESYTGYKIPANAVRVVNGVKGVYILRGNTVHFREIVVLAETDGFFIVEEQPSYFEDEFYYKKLGLYDMVITSGKNLYDGKIISASGVNS